MEELIQPNPASLASLHIDSMELFYTDSSDESQRSREDSLTELERMALEFGYLDKKYLVQARKAFIVSSDPVLEYMKSDEVGNILFRGELKTYGHLEIGEIMANHAVRALCLAFDQAVRLPDFEPIDERELLLVPARSIATIHRTK